MMSKLSPLAEGKVNSYDPATTLALLKLTAVVGVTGIFDESGDIQSMGIQCALCHSTMDNSSLRGLAAAWMDGHMDGIWFYDILERSYCNLEMHGKGIFYDPRLNDAQHRERPRIASAN